MKTNEFWKTRFMGTDDIFTSMPQTGCTLCAYTTNLVDKYDV